MKRRKWLSTVVLATALPGCADTESTPRTDGESSRAEQTDTESTGGGTGTGSCEWPDMCEGTNIVEVTVSAEFSGEVVLNAGCRDRTRTVEPGETHSVTRQSDAESCELRLTVDGEELFDRTVTRDGELERSMVVL